MDDEEENKFLIAVDLENANVIDKVETVTVEKTDISTEVNKHRFVNYSAHRSLFSGCRKYKGFYGQQFGWLFAKLSYLDPLFCCFLRPETVHSGTCFAIFNIHRKISAF